MSLPVPTRGAPQRSQEARALLMMRLLLLAERVAGLETAYLRLEGLAAVEKLLFLLQFKLSFRSSIVVSFPSERSLNRNFLPTLEVIAVRNLSPLRQFRENIKMETEN